MSLKTPESIGIYLQMQWFDTKQYSNKIILFLVQHVTVFEQDLCQLVMNLKEFIFLDIYGGIPLEKVQAYRSMAQTRFSKSRIDVELSRFRLWL
jgi:hypothetical protein